MQDLQAIAAEQLGSRGRAVSRMLAGADSAALASAAERAGRRYGLDSLRAAEAERWAAHQRRLADLRDRFVDGPTLRLRPGALQITLDPNRQTSLGAAGTVVGGLAWRSADGGALEAPEGALVPPDWSEIRLPLDVATASALVEGTLSAPVEARAPSWRLTLPAGWRLSREGRDWVARPPASAGKR